MRAGEHAVGEYMGSTMTQIVAILIALSLLSVVAIPRYMEEKRAREQEARVAEAHEFMRALHVALSLHVAGHYLRGTEWVRNGEELMELLEEGWAMPEGMRYSNNLWIDERTGVAWEFKASSDRLPPRIRRLEQRPPPETLEIEPIEHVNQGSFPET
jgi:hypothetical protein